MRAAQIVWRHLVVDTEVGAARSHHEIESVDGAATRTRQHETFAIALQLGQQGLRRFGKS
jgi:hypothetical protein